MRMHKKDLGIFLALIIVSILAVMLFFAYRHQGLLERAAENMLYAANPTADRAFAYGMRHFQAASPSEYDVQRAQYFFNKARALDSSYPMVNFELSRIEFLRSDFDIALALANEEFKVNPHPHPATYYLRALIEGYSGDYSAAEKDYETYFKVTPANWAGINDYAWVLLKDDLPEGAHAALMWGLKQWPENAWLLSNDATALYELGRYQEAAAQAERALPAVRALTVDDWLAAYPGNDPLIAGEGLAHFKKSSEENLQKILAKAK